MKRVEFGILLKKPNGEISLSTERGWQVFIEGIELVAHIGGYDFVNDEPFWRVSDPITGTMFVGDYPTRKKAIAAAVTKIKEKGADAVKKAIALYRGKN